MRLIVTTVFEGVDQEFLDKFISRQKAQGDRDLILAMDNLEKTGSGYANDINPDDEDMQVTTSYRVIRI